MKLTSGGKKGRHWVDDSVDGLRESLEVDFARRRRV